MKEDNKENIKQESRFTVFLRQLQTDLKGFVWFNVLFFLFRTAFILLFGSRRIQKRASETLKAHALAVSDGIQESLENVREIRATNREKEFLDRLNQKIDRLEKTMKNVYNSPIDDPRRQRHGQ